MKKVLFTIVLSLFILGKITAQVKSFEIGVRGGAGISTVYFDDTEYRNSFAIGASMELSLNRTLSLALQPSYESKGCKFESTSIENGSVVGGGEYDYKLNYFKLPVLARFGFGDNVRFVVSIGAYLGILINSDIESLSSYGKPEYYYTGYNQLGFELGLTNAYGIEVPITDRLIFEFDLCGNLGTKSGHQVAPGQESKSPGASHTTFSVLGIVGVNYRFPF